MAANLKQLEKDLDAETAALKARLELIENTKQALSALFGKVEVVLEPKALQPVSVPNNLREGTLPTTSLILSALQDGPLPSDSIAQRIWQDKTVKPKPLLYNVLKGRISVALNKLRVGGTVKNTPTGWALTKTARKPAEELELKPYYKPVLGSRAFNEVYKKLNRDRTTMPTARLVTALLKHRRMSVASIAEELWKDKRIKQKPSTRKNLEDRVRAAINKLRVDGKVKLMPQGWMLVRKPISEDAPVVDTTQQPVEYQVQ